MKAKKIILAAMLFMASSAAVFADGTPVPLLGRDYALIPKASSSHVQILPMKWAIWRGLCKT